MSDTVDVNVLVYATDEASPRHAACRDLVDRLVSGPNLVVLLWPALFGYLRIATNQTISPRPLTPRKAEANVAALLGGRNTRVVGEADGFWSVYRSVAAELPLRGNMVSDAHLVALMREHGIATIWTFDRDFRKFSGITAREP